MKFLFLLGIEDLGVLEEEGLFEEFIAKLERHTGSPPLRIL